MKRVFVTGHLGYIGAHLVDLLKQHGHHVTGCDLGLYEGCACDVLTPPDGECLCDIRNLTAEDLYGYDCVMHLAAISNDPMGELDSQLTYNINYEGTVALAKASKEAGVPLFLFASSCSIYGKSGSAAITESGATAPLTLYAASKIRAEQALAAMGSHQFRVGLLRNATAYGFSPMLRIDLVLNNLLASAFAYGEIRVMSDGSPWRPLIHCRDIARAFVAWMDHPPQEDALALNIGSNNENYQVYDIVQRAKAKLPGTKVVFTGEAGHDPRNYRVDFSLLQHKLPGFRCEFSLDLGIEELLQKYRQLGFGARDFEGDRFVRLRRLASNLYRCSSHYPKNGS